MSEADPWGLFLSVWGYRDMTKAAILIDGGYFLKWLPTIRPDVNAADVEATAQTVNQLVRGHLNQLNEVHHVENSLRQSSI